MGRKGGKSVRRKVKRKSVKGGATTLYELKEEMETRMTKMETKMSNIETTMVTRMTKIESATLSGFDNLNSEMSTGDTATAVFGDKNDHRDIGISGKLAALTERFDILEKYVKGTNEQPAGWLRSERVLSGRVAKLEKKLESETK